METEELLKDLNERFSSLCNEVVLYNGFILRAKYSIYHKDLKVYHYDSLEHQLYKDVNYDMSYIQMTNVWAQNSYAKRKKVGALFVKDEMIISDGFNGTPSGFPNVCEDENNASYPYVMHAEQNALSKLACSTQSSKNATLYVSMSPCTDCAKQVIQSKTKKVVFWEFYRLDEGVDWMLKSGIDIYYYNSYLIDEFIFINR